MVAVNRMLAGYWSSAYRQRGRSVVVGVERGHRTPVITRKGGNVVTIPLAPRTPRAIDLGVGERCEGPVFLAAGGQRLSLNVDEAAAALLAGIQGGVSIMLSTGQSAHLRAALDWWIARLHAASGVAR